MAFFQRPQSAAIPIVAPEPRSTTSSPGLSSQKPAIRKETQPKLCKHVLIHGSCKYEGTTCTFFHPPKPSEGAHSAGLTSPAQPSAPAPLAADAPVFVPKLASGADGSPLFSSATPAEIVRALSPLSAADVHQQQAAAHYAQDGYDPYGIERAMGSLDLSDGHDMNDMASSGYYSTQLTLDDYLPQPLDYHLYTQTMPPRMMTDPHRPHVPGYFMSELTRDMLLRRAQLTRAAPPPGAFALPEEVSGYHSLVPVENIAPERRRTFGPHHGTVYRAVKTSDGLCYALRRVENYRLSHEQAFSALEPWTHIRHPNIVSVREGFTTRTFNDDSLVVVYDFHADSQTLAEKFVRPRTSGRRSHAQDQQVSEQTMWSFIIQIANALKAVHDRGLAMRTIDITKIIHSGKNRLRVGTCGIFDMLLYNQIQDTQLNQQEDLVQFGKLIFQLACNNIAATNNLPKAIETLTRHYSPDLKNVALFLISKPSPLKTVGQLFDMVGSRLLTEMDAMQDYADQLESDLMSELENGRLVRLLCKFGFINERPEFDMDPRWSETGERYPIKLFRDYVFHQVDERGRPHLNLAHVITCLNKLDAGSEERIMLTSREEQNCLVITYKEIKTCLEAAFGELSRPR